MGDSPAIISRCEPRPVERWVLTAEPRFRSFVRRHMQIKCPPHAQLFYLVLAPQRENKPGNRDLKNSKNNKNKTTTSEPSLTCGAESAQPPQEVVHVLKFSFWGLSPCREFHIIQLRLSATLITF